MVGNLRVASRHHTVYDCTYISLRERDHSHCVASMALEVLGRLPHCDEVSHLFKYNAQHAVDRERYDVDIRA
jgi:hypothetical protein